MSQVQSPSTGRQYGRAPVLAVWGLPRSTFCARQHRANKPVTSQRRGPKTSHTDAGPLEKIRAILAASPFHGEGHRKIWARPLVQDVRTSKPRGLRLMRENQLLAPQRQLAPVVEKSHAGSIVTDKPNQMWGTDATATVTLADGQVTVCAAIDHCTAECVGIHAVRRATRLRPRPGHRARLGGALRRIHLPGTLPAGRPPGRAVLAVRPLNPYRIRWFGIPPAGWPLPGSSLGRSARSV
jgi:hypothetical protein